MLIYYMENYPNAVIRHKAIDVVLHVDSDAAYLTIPEARFFYAGIFYLRDWPSPRPVKTTPKRNGRIHTECKTIHNVVSSSSESETCGTLNTRKTSIDMWPALIALYHKQTATPFKADNLTTEGFVNSGMKPKRSKTWDIKWHLLRDKEVVEQIILYWYRGKNNNADYVMKHHPQIHHRQMRPRYIHTSNLVRKIPQTIRLFKGVLNQVQCSQSWIRYDYLNPIQL